MGVSESRAAVLRRRVRSRFSSANDDVGGAPDVRAADLQEEMAEQRFPFRQIRRRRRQPSNIAASGASNPTGRDCTSSAQGRKGR